MKNGEAIEMTIKTENLFSDILDLCNGFLHNCPDPNPDRFMREIEGKIKEYNRIKEGKETGVTLTIEADDGDDLPMILERVKKLIEEGYTSGIEPDWKIEGGSK